MAENGRVFKKKRYTGNIISIKVGINSSNTFFVHETVLKETSTFFLAALDKPWKERSERTINLPEDEPDIVSAYVDWLYNDQIHLSGDIEPEDWKDGDSDPEYQHLAQLYVFGEKVQDNAFCDAVVSTLCAYVDTGGANYWYFPEHDAINTIYSGTSPSSPMRKLLVDIWLDQAQSGWYTGHENNGFMRDLAIAFMQSKGGNTHATELYEKREKWFKQT